MNDLFSSTEKPAAKIGNFTHDRDLENGKEEWLTPPYIIAALGEFDLDPCAPIVRPWDTAKQHYTIQDNGLIKPWAGRVWLNPPYGNKMPLWMRRMSEHTGGGHRVNFCADGNRGFLSVDLGSRPFVSIHQGPVEISSCHRQGRRNRRCALHAHCLFRRGRGLASGRKFVGENSRQVFDERTGERRLNYVTRR